MARLPKGKVFLKMAVNALLIGLKEIPGYGMLVEIGHSCWEILRDAQDDLAEEERIAQLEQAGACSPQEAREIAEAVIAEKQQQGETITGEKAEAIVDLLATMPAVIREHTQATLQMAKKTGTAPHKILPVTSQFSPQQREAFYQSLFPARRSCFKAGDDLPHGNPEWQLATLVGMGGFGEVWTARHQFLGDHWAVKFCQNTESIKILQREAQTLYALRKSLPRHSNIVALLDLQLRREPYWLAFEYVPGGTLEALMWLGAMDYEQVLDLLLPVIEAIAAVHRQGIIHRDLKPGNLLLGADNRLKVADFGIGKVTAEQELGRRPLTAMSGFTTLGYGSPNYMSPEQRKAMSAHSVDDVYALAVILWQMCSGCLDALDYPNQITDLKLPKKVEELLIRCVFSPPEKRPQNAGEMLEALKSGASVANQTPTQPLSDVQIQTQESIVEDKITRRLRQMRETVSWANKIAQDEYGIYAEFIYQGITQTMRWIEPGEFLMGSPKDEPKRYDNETQHKVRITQGYWLADTACTQALWQAVMGDNPSHFKGQDNPVGKVSWNDIQNFLKKLNQQNPGLKARLPTEAQWEYACRAGTTTPFWFGNNITPEQVNYNGNYPYPGEKKGRYRVQTVPVKELPCNSWGLYQMHGNVLEWCQDWYSDYPQHSLHDPVTDPEGPRSGSFRVLRGGCWSYGARFARSAYRYWLMPDGRYSDWGFRFCLG